MAFLTKLDVINDMLASLGEVPLNSLDEDHPLVAAGKTQLDISSAREQAKGWWFNKEIITLQPDVTTNEILVPGDCLSVDPLDPNRHLIQRGRRLYDPSMGSYKFNSGTSIQCRLVRFIPFEDLPPTAAVYIGQSAVLMFQKAYDADPQKTANLKQDLREAYVAFNAEHIRNMQVNLLGRPSTAALLGGLGITPRLGGVLL
jgi:hypothetical protein